METGAVRVQAAAEDTMGVGVDVGVGASAAGVCGDTSWAARQQPTSQPARSQE